MSTEKTFVMVKPNGVAGGHVGDIVARFERRGLRLCGLRLMRVDEDLAAKHYAEHVSKPFYPALMTFITSGPVVAMVLEGPEAIGVARTMMGPTNPFEAPPGRSAATSGSTSPPTSSTAPTDPRARSVRSTSTSTPPTWSELKLVLASRSPQREAILRQLGIPFRVRVSEYAEVLSGDDPASLVVANAVGKARDVERHVRHDPPVLVLGVDTIVVVDGEVLGKPADPATASRSLRRLAGRAHQVHSGLCLTDGAREETGHATTHVTFRTLDDEMLARYVACGEWRQRAGGYAIQGVGSALVTGVEGDYWNVVGLPVDVLIGALDSFGLAPLSWA